MNFGVTAVLFAPPIVALSYVVVMAFRRRSAPGGRYLVYLTGSNLLWLCGYAVQLNLQVPKWNILVAQIEFFGVATSPVLFLLFAVRYTQGYSLSRRQEAGLFLIPAVTLVLVWTNPLHGLMWSDYQIRGWYGLALTQRQFGPWFFVHGVYSYLTFLAGVMLFVNLLMGRNFLFRRQAVAILIGTLIPLSLATPFLLGLSPISGLDLTPFGFVVMGLAFGYAFFNTEFYDVVPAIKTIGWESVADEIDSGILVTDMETKVIEANRTACRMFGVDWSDIIGRPITAIFRDNDSFTQVNNGYEIVRDEGIFEMQTTSIRDGRGERIGFTFTVVNVTDRRQREQQLQVLNRVLRHNLRNKAMVLTGNAERIETITDVQANDDRLSEINGLATSVVDAAERISEMSNTAREIDGIIQESSLVVQNLTEVVESSITSLEETHETENIRIDGNCELAVRASPRLEQVFVHLLRNAFEHNPSGTTISVRAFEREETVEIEIEDDGSGIPEHELEPLESGVETALNHGSGLGLWFVRWTVETSNGSIDIEVDDGTTVTLRLPRANPDGTTETSE
jgi:signal transduction histidine kinase